MSANDDEFPMLRHEAGGCAPPFGSRQSRTEPESILRVPFGINSGVLVKELRQLADAVEAGEVFPQEFVRTQRDLVDDFKMFTLAVTFGSPSPPSELQS